MNKINKQTSIFIHINKWIVSNSILILIDTLTFCLSNQIQLWIDSVCLDFVRSALKTDNYFFDVVPDSSRIKILVIRVYRRWRVTRWRHRLHSLVFCSPGSDIKFNNVRRTTAGTTPWANHRCKNDSKLATLCPMMQYSVLKPLRSRIRSWSLFALHPPLIWSSVSQSILCEWEIVVVLNNVSWYLPYCFGSKRRGPSSLSISSSGVN